MFAEVRLRTGINWYNYTIITQLKDLAFDTKYQDIGSFGFTVLQDYADAMNLGDDSVIEIAPNGVSQLNMWYAVDGTSGSKTADDTLWKTVSGKSIISWLSDCAVYPSSWPTLPTKNSDGSTTPIISGHSFQNATPGTILRTLIARGKERGGLIWLDETNFTGTTTSANSAWAATLTTTYANGTTLLQVLQDLAARRLIQFRMNGMQLQVFNYDSQIRHLTPEQVTFRRGQNMLQQTTNTDSSSTSSVVLIEGDQTAIAEVSTTPDGTQAPYTTRRKELFVSQGGITDLPTLQMLGKAELAINGHIKFEESIGVSDSYQQPWVDYTIGDWVWEDKSGVLENIQVKQIAATSQDANNLLLGLTLGDMLDDQDIKMQLRIDNITGQNAGNYGGLPNQIQNYLAPSAPTGISAFPTAYRDLNGNDFDQVTITWAAPVTNIDGTDLSDLDRYEVQYKTNSATAWAQAANVSSAYTAAYVSAQSVGASFTCQVRAVDTDGNASAWDVLPTPIVLPRYTVIPPKPSVPVVTTSLRGINILWDGLDYTGAAYDTSWLRVDVHVSVSNTFTPSATTLKGSFTTRGGLVNISGLAYGNTYYVKLIAVDKSGNVSVPSAVSAGAVPGQLSDPDLPAKLVTGAKIADGTINTAQLTVASFGDSVVPNGSFEDAASAPTDDLAAHWKTFQDLGASTIARSTTTGDAATGTACIKANLTATPWNIWFGNSDDIPTSPGDLWYVNFKVKASRAMPSAVAAALNFGQVGVTLPVFGDPQNNIYTIVVADVTTAWTQVEGQILVPSGTTPGPITKCRLTFQVNSPDAASAIVYIDDVSLAPVRGSAYIKDASIVNAKINNVSVDKVTAGTLNAEVIVGNRITTSDTGARVELNSVGIQAFDGLGNKTLEARDVDGSVTVMGALIGGSIDLPSKVTQAGFKMHADQNGLLASGFGTINLSPDPSFETSPALQTKSANTTAIYTNKSSRSGGGQALFGDQLIDVSSTESSGAWAEVIVGKIQPSTQYVLSIYFGTFNTSSFTGNFPSLTFETSNFLGRAGATNVFQGLDGWLSYDGSSVGTSNPPFNPSPIGFYNANLAITADEWVNLKDQSIYAPQGRTTTFVFDATSGKSKDIGSGFSRRLFKAFITPSTIPANSDLILRLPSGQGSGANLPVHHNVYDGVQLEQDYVIPSTYTAGDIAACDWVGTSFASSSTRGNKDKLVITSSGTPSFPSGLSRGSGGAFGSNIASRYRSISQTVASDTFVPLMLNLQKDESSVLADDGIIWFQNAFYTPVTGWYCMSATCFFPNDVGQQQVRWIDLSANEVVFQTQNGGGGATTITCSGIDWFPGGRFIQPQILHSAGSNLAFTAQTPGKPARATFGILA